MNNIFQNTCNNIFLHGVVSPSPKYNILIDVYFDFQVLLQELKKYSIKCKPFLCKNLTPFLSRVRVIADHKNLKLRSKFRKCT